jgi:hypothetical protein
MTLPVLAALAALAAGAAAPAPKLTLLFTADNWGELAPCG